jgi:hypothetical protein
MVIKRIGPLSAAKVSFVLYAFIGLIVGAFVALIGMMGFALGDAGSTGPFLGMALGVGAIIVMPVFYGVIGFLVALISAAIYNLAAGIVGGVELELQ